MRGVRNIACPPTPPSLSSTVIDIIHKAFPAECWIAYRCPKRDHRTLRLPIPKGMRHECRADVLTGCHDQLRRPRRSDDPVAGERSLNSARHTDKTGRSERKTGTNPVR